MMQRPIEVLLVEDSPGDLWLTRETLMQGKVPKHINVVTNGEQALDYIRRRGSFSKASRPDLILLDLNLPRRDGLEVLREIKNDEQLRSITVVVLTTSEAPADVNAAYDLNANCYVVKPVDLEAFTAAIRGIEDFWMTTAMLPTMSSSPISQHEKGSAASGGTASRPNGAGAASRVCVREPLRGRRPLTAAVAGRAPAGRPRRRCRQSA